MRAAMNDSKLVAAALQADVAKAMEVKNVKMGRRPK